MAGTNQDVRSSRTHLLRTQTPTGVPPPIREVRGEAHIRMSDNYRERYSEMVQERDQWKERHHALEDALLWIQEFAAKMSDQHTGFVHAERRARQALAASGPDTPAARPSPETSPFAMPMMEEIGTGRTVAGPDTPAVTE